MKQIKIFRMARINRDCVLKIDPGFVLLVLKEDLASDKSMHALLRTGTWFKSSLPRICIDSSEPLLLVHTRKGC